MTILFKSCPFHKTIAVGGSWTSCLFRYSLASEVKASRCYEQPECLPGAYHRPLLGDIIWLWREIQRDPSLFYHLSCQIFDLTTPDLERQRWMPSGDGKQINGSKTDHFRSRKRAPDDDRFTKKE